MNPQVASGMRHESFDGTDIDILEDALAGQRESDQIKSYEEAKTRDPDISSGSSEPARNSSKDGDATRQVAAGLKEEKPTAQVDSTQPHRQAGVDHLKRMAAAWVNGSNAYQGESFIATDVKHSDVDESDYRMELKLEIPDEQGKVFSLKVMIDSGSSVNWIKPTFADEHKIKWAPKEGMRNWTVGSGDKFTPNGVSVIKFAAGHHKIPYSEVFYVYDGLPADIILGLVTCDHHMHMWSINPEFSGDVDDEGPAQGEKPSPNFLMFGTHPGGRTNKDADTIADRKRQQNERLERRMGPKPSRR